MNSSHEALYRAICAQPNEDTPRLMFADLVEEDGDTLRAQFIRTQIALANVPAYDPAWVNARQFETDAALGWAMAHTLPKVPSGYSWRQYEFRRGFPWMIHVLSLNALAQSEELFSVAPIQALDVDLSVRSDFGTFTDWPHLSRLHKLEFSDGWFGADEITQLVESPHAANLTEFDFEGEGIAPDGLTALAASALFTRLKGLELRSNAIPSALLVDSLSAATEPGLLSRLSLPYNRIDRDDAENLFRLPLMQGLQHLDVSDNDRLGPDGVTALAESGLLRGLRILNLSKTLPGVAGVKALTAARGLAGLRMLDLSDNRLGPVAVKVLAGCGGFRGLRVLNLTNNPLGDAGASALAESRALSGLLELDLRDTGVGYAGALALARSPHLSGLLRLDLRNRDQRPLADAAREALFERFGDRVCF
jgi:uncharacterized protein (TIGR02996 family)